MSKESIAEARRQGRLLRRDFRVESQRLMQELRELGEKDKKRK